MLLILGSVLAAISDSVLGIIIGRALQGAGAIAGTVMALLADLTSEEQRTKAMAVVGISFGLSFAVALVTGPMIAAFGGLSAVFWARRGVTNSARIDTVPTTRATGAMMRMVRSNVR